MGSFDLAAARTLEQLGAAFAFVPLASAARSTFAARELTEDEVRALRFGQRIAPGGTGELPVAGFSPDGEFVALLHDADGSARSLFVVQPDLALTPL